MVFTKLISLSRQFKICTSIPVINSYTDDKDILKNKITEAFNKGSDLVELRFDFLSTFNNIDTLLNSISEFNHRSVFTLRTKNEGGMFEMSEFKRIEILKKLTEIQPLFVDIEYNLILENEDFADWLDNNNIRIIASWHDFSKTPSREFLIDLIDNMRIFSNFIKVVTTAKNIEDSITMLELYDSIDTQVNLIAFAMGEYGILSRVLGPIITDIPFGYATLDKPLAPGQLTLTHIKSINKLLKKRLL